MKDEKLTREILLNSGFTNVETSKEDLEHGHEYWYLGQGNYISNSDFLITMFNSGSFLVRYHSNVVYGLRTIKELQAALSLFKCEHLVTLNL